MDDAQIGSVFRVVRLRLGLTQGQVAAMAGSGRPIVSLIERGGVEQTSLRVARALARSLGISLSMDARWRSAAMAKLLDERYVALVRAVAGHPPPTRVRSGPPGPLPPPRNPPRPIGGILSR